jgi:hypothetical protein
MLFSHLSILATLLLTTPIHAAPQVGAPVTFSGPLGTISTGPDGVDMTSPDGASLEFGPLGATYESPPMPVDNIPTETLSGPLGSVSRGPDGFEATNPLGAGISIGPNGVSFTPPQATGIAGVLYH